MTTMTKTKKTVKKATKGHSAVLPTKPERYTVVIEDLVIAVERMQDGWYIVTCPFDRELVTQGRTLDEAVAMAKDAKKTLAEARAKPSRSRKRLAEVRA
jgi:predicted RNase H-like HicB family nuclease